jgi:hypothetical protein
MLKGEVIDLISKNKYTISFFDDDSIDTIRQKIGAAIDIHPDRLFILVGLSLPSEYYMDDPRHWEGLFDRLSYNGDPITRDIFSEYQLSYRVPTTSIAAQPYDRATWMSKPDSLQPILTPGVDFLEYRIFGVEEVKSFVLPLANITSNLPSRISSAKLPIPDNTTLFNSLYIPSQFLRFVVRPYDELAESNAQVYYPFLRSTTPSKLTEESVRLLQKNATTLKDLLALEVPQPDVVSIIRTRFYIPWVETDFGSAIRTRFEQIFYGITVSSDIPCISLFTSKDQISRHKFFTEDCKLKKPHLDISIWNSWWSVKPARNIPTLILFRGKSKHHFDRVTITALDMVISTHRPEGNTETIDQLKRQVRDWISSYDAIMPFIVQADLRDVRWELQDISYLAKYSSKLEEFDLRRFNCVSSIFDIADKTRSQFSLLRTDHSNSGLSAVEVKLLQMLKDSSGNLKPDTISQELSIPIQNARELLQQLQTKLEEDPRIGEKVFRGYPTMRLGVDYTIVSSISNLEHSLNYANVLRYILSNVESAQLNAICPKRSEKVSVETTLISTEPLEIDAALEEEYGDLFGYLEESEDVAEEETIQEEQPEKAEKIATDQKQLTSYNYFKSRLQKFDPVTFDPTGSQYPKKCEQKHQPIILSEAEVTRLATTPYNIKSGKYAPDQLIELENPDGTVVCPEYWCMKDQIPLKDDELEKSGGEIRCPVCHGKLQTRANDNPREYPLIKRETGFVYPGFVEYKAPRNGHPMPCCFKKSRSKKNEMTEKKNEDRYYILGETKQADPERIAFVPLPVLVSLRIKETYETFQEGTVRRLMSPNKGYFRAGLGHPSQTLPMYLNLKTKIPSPKEAVDIVLKCSFIHTWKRFGTTHLESIHNKLDHIEDSLTRDALTKIISGIDEAYTSKQLTLIEELEYSALALQCDIFRIYLESGTLGCTFYSPMVRQRSRAIVVLQFEDQIDILAYTERKSRGFEFRTNIYESPFTKETYSELEKVRNQSCKLTIPSYSDALLAIQQILPMIDADEYQIILDPFQHAQALYVPSKLILPFQPSPLPDVTQSKISGYTDIPIDRLPEYSSIKELLKTASTFSPGFAFKEDVYNSNRKKVEILLESGLRIPVKPLQSLLREPTDVIETIKESELTFGKESKELKNNQRDISYQSEVYEFLLFQLTKDLETDYKELRDVLQSIPLKQEDLQPILEKWFTETTHFVNIKEPKQFLSKIREPCNSKCEGELCGWDGNVCKVKITSAIKKDSLFTRLLSTLVENSKIRAMVLDGRTTPFFSTILYLELPHEVIMTDTDLP